MDVRQKRLVRKRLRELGEEEREEQTPSEVADVVDSEGVRDAPEWCLNNVLESVLSNEGIAFGCWSHFTPVPCQEKAHLRFGKTRISRRRLLVAQRSLRTQSPVKSCPPNRTIMLSAANEEHQQAPSAKASCESCPRTQRKRNRDTESVQKTEYDQIVYSPHLCTYFGRIGQAVRTSAGIPPANTDPACAPRLQPHC